MYLKGDFAVGYYLDSRWKENTASPYHQDYTKDILSHHKSVYFRFGNIAGRNRMQFTFGMDHVTQWGGKLYTYRHVNGQKQYAVTDQPQGIDDFFRVVIAKEGSSKASSADNAYVSGSQWGAYLFRFDCKLTDKNQFSIYTNHFFAVWYKYIQKRRRKAGICLPFYIRFQINRPGNFQRPFRNRHQKNGRCRSKKHLKTMVRSEERSEV